MSKVLVFFSVLLSVGIIQAGEYDSYVINPSVVTPEALCEKYRDKAMPKARPDLNIVGINYSAQVPVYVVSSAIAHGYACGYKAITKSNKITDFRIEIDAETGQSKMEIER